MDEWQPIEAPPEDGTPVVVYFSKVEFHLTDGTAAPSLGPTRDFVERCELGWYAGGRWWEAGTGHDMFECWRDESQLPTHWKSLFGPPAAQP